MAGFAAHTLCCVGTGLAVGGRYCCGKIWRLFSVTLFSPMTIFPVKWPNNLWTLGWEQECFFFAYQGWRLWTNFAWQAVCSAWRWSSSGLKETSILSLWGSLSGSDENKIVAPTQARPFFFCFWWGFFCLFL